MFLRFLRQNMDRKYIVIVHFLLTYIQVIILQVFVHRWRAMRGLRTQETSYAGRSSSAPTEDTRMSADESAMRLKDIH